MLSDVPWSVVFTYAGDFLSVIAMAIMATSFFLGRRSVVPSAHSGMPLWQDRLFIYLMKNAANPTEFFKIPPGRVVELGAQVTV